MKLMYKFFYNLNEVKISGMWFFYDVFDFFDFGRICVVIVYIECLLCLLWLWKLEYWS